MGGTYLVVTLGKRILNQGLNSSCFLVNLEKVKVVRGVQIFNNLTEKEKLLN